MSNAGDIRELLDGWPFDPENDARIVRGKDGRKVLQVRTPLGLEQLEMLGRPDGARPHGLESALEFHQQRLARPASHNFLRHAKAESCAHPNRK